MGYFHRGMELHCLMYLNHVSLSYEWIRGFFPDMKVTVESRDWLNNRVLTQAPKFISSSIRLGNDHI